MVYIQVGDSALMWAAREGETGVVKELVERGADLNLQNKVCKLKSGASPPCCDNRFFYTCIIYDSTVRTIVIYQPRTLSQFGSLTLLTKNALHSPSNVLMLML